MNNMIDVSLAGLTFPCRLRYPETARYFPAPNPAARCVGGDPVCLTDEDWQYYLSDGMEDCAHTEFSLLTAAFSDALMDHERIILHAVAIRWRDKSYLIAAQSGNGKSTQARFLQQLRPGEFSVICGDRPVLSFHDNEILVHPSHWNGKENWYGAEAAPLAGVILLRRSEENAICPLSPREAAIRTYAQIIQTCADPEKMKKAAALVTKLLNAVPIWQLTSFQVPDSTKLLLETVFV